MLGRKDRVLHISTAECHRHLHSIVLHQKSSIGDAADNGSAASSSGQDRSEKQLLLESLNKAIKDLLLALGLNNIATGDWDAIIKSGGTSNTGRLVSTCLGQSLHVCFDMFAMKRCMQHIHFHDNANLFGWMALWTTMFVY